MSRSKSRFLLSIVVLIAVPAAAAGAQEDQPETAGQAVAAIDCQPVGASGLLAQADEAGWSSLPEIVDGLAPEPVPASTCNAWATCHNGTTKDCTGNSVCKSRDANCPGQRGYVECDGVKKWCPPCPCTCSASLDCFSDSDCCVGPCSSCSGVCVKDSPFAILGTCSCN